MGIRVVRSLHFQDWKLDSRGDLALSVTGRIAHTAIESYQMTATYDGHL